MKPYLKNNAWWVRANDGSEVYVEPATPAAPIPQTRHAPRKASKVTLTNTANPFGVGSELKKIFKFRPCDACQATLDTMNEYGPETCRSKKDALVQEVKKKREDPGQDHSDAHAHPRCRGSNCSCNREGDRYLQRGVQDGSAGYIPLQPSAPQTVNGYLPPVVAYHEASPGLVPLLRVSVRQRRT